MLQDRGVIDMELGPVADHLADSGRPDAKVTELVLLELVRLELWVLVGLLEGDRVEVRLEEFEKVLIEVGRLLELGDDVGPQVPGPRLLCWLLLHRDHPRPLQVLEGLERGLLLRLGLLLVLQQRLLLLWVAALHPLHQVREDVGDLPLHR